MRGISWIVPAVLLLLRCSATIAVAELSVTITIDYTPPPGVVLGPTEYRAASGPVDVNCTAIGGTGNITYQWSSTCRDCLFNSSTSSSIRRAAVHSGDTGIHTCMAITAENVGSASFPFTVVGAGIHVFNGLPKGSLPNNGLVSFDTNDPKFRLRFFCRSDSNKENVGTIIGLGGSPIVTQNGTFFEISNPQPGEVSVSNFSTDITASGQGVYTCRIPLESGEIREINIGIYPSGFTAIPSITRVIFNSQSSHSNLTCISTRSPVTTVTWNMGNGVSLTMRDGDSMTVNKFTYRLTQTVTCRHTSTYMNELIITPPSVGNIAEYSCTVANTLGHSDSKSVETYVSIFTSGSPTFGGNFTLSCDVSGVMGAKVVYSWSGPNTANTISSSNQISITYVGLADAGIYTCRATVDSLALNLTANKIVTVAVPKPAVNISSSVKRGDVYAGSVLTLTCTIETLTNIIVTVNSTWMKKSIKLSPSSNGRRIEIAEVQQTDTSHIYTSTVTFNTLRTNDAGDYICVASVNHKSQFITDGKTMVNKTIVIKDPTLQLSITSNTTRLPNVPPHNTFSLTCTATAPEGVVSPKTFTWWRRNGQTGDGFGMIHNHSNTTFVNSDINQSKSISVLTVTETSVGDYHYQCRVNLIDLMIMSMHDAHPISVTTISPRINVSLTSNTTRLPNEPPYNTFSLTCTATVPEGVVSPKTFTWWRNNSKLNTSSENFQITNSTLAQPISTNMLVVTETEPGIYHYFCEVAIAERFRTDIYSINVIGPEPPEMPTNLTAGNITANSATIYWTVTIITFTPETYVVHYGTSMESLKFSSDPTENNFTAVKYNFSITLKSLASNTLYYYHVNSTNTNGSVLSNVASFTTEASDSSSAAAVGGVVTTVVLMIVITCIVIIAVWRLKKRSGEKVHLKAGPTTMVNIELTMVGDTENDKEYAVISDVRDVTHRQIIPIALFGEHISTMHTNRDEGFDAEYSSIKKVTSASHHVSGMPWNQERNRFVNIYPYDFSRVKLKEIKGVEGSDYINASFMDGYRREREYIAAQGPVPETVGDFWRMIWEYKLTTIVMLTKCEEGGRHKCQQYWPNDVNKTLETGHNLVITLTKLQPFVEFEIRNLTVKNFSNPDEPALEVTHFYYLSWPDHGVPTRSTSFINFIRRVRKVHPYSIKVPLLVHCSAGVGRTGTFIVIDIEMQRIEAERVVDVYGCLNKLRSNRVKMVQTLTQYIFIHKALHELITCGETDIIAGDLRIKISRLHQTVEGKNVISFEEQFQVLEQVSLDANMDYYPEANSQYNLLKNRYASKVAGRHGRVCLTRRVEIPGSDYINANFIEGYRQPSAYIATQGPMASTVKDFWKMIWEHQSRCIVMLCNMQEEGEESCYPYWPETPEATETHDKIGVTLLSEERHDICIIRKLEINSKPMGVMPPEPITVTQFHLTCWPLHDKPSPPSSLLEVIENMAKVQMATGNRPITVMCNDGVGRTGAFICLHAQMERLKTEGVVDCFQFIKSARLNRPGLVQNVEQYILCHELLCDYVESFDTYANFKELV